MSDELSKQELDERFRRGSDRLLDSRLEGIENQLRDTNKLLERFARLEEQSIDRTRRIDKLEQLQDVTEKRLRALESGETKQTQLLTWIERGFWLCVAAALAWATKTNV